MLQYINSIGGLHKAYREYWESVRKSKSANANVYFPEIREHGSIFD
jgi:hypothetical protein